MDPSIQTKAAEYAKQVHLDPVGYDGDYGLVVDITINRPGGGWVLAWYDRRPWGDGRRASITAAIAEAFAEHGAIISAAAEHEGAFVALFDVSREKDCGLVVEACRECVPRVLQPYLVGETEN